MEFSRRIVDVKTSATLKAKLKALELQAQGVRVINLSAGEPSFDTPEKIKQACQKALDENFTRYGPVNGILKLREAIQQKLKRISGVEVSPEAIVVACGAKQAIFSALFILLNEGDEVLLPVPYWVTYPAQIKLAGGRPVFMPTDESTGFKITPKHLKKAVTDKTRMLILNSPANPTGSCYTGEELTALGKICSDKNIWVLSDEIYDEITFDGFQHVSFLKACPFHQERTILINGASKAYAMTGWRMGYAAGPLEFVEKLKILQGQEITSIPTFIQHACVTAFNDCDEEVKKMRAEYAKRRDIALKRLLKIKGVKCFKPQGAFYLFPDMRAYKKTGVELSDFLLEKAHVSVVPGESFGAEGHIRISFVNAGSEIEEGLEWMQKALEAL